MHLPDWKAFALVVFVALAWVPGGAAVAATLDCTPRQPRAVADLPAVQRRGLLWEVRSPDGAVGHLYGTIHLADARVTTLSPQLQRILEASTRFGMEVVFDAATLTTLAQAMWAVEGDGLADALEPALYARTLELLAPYGIDGRAAAKLKPWAAYTTLSLPPGQDGAPLDLKLMTLAQQAGKPLFGIETLSEQMAVFERLSVEDQVALLREAVCHYADQQRDVDTLVAAYARRDLASLHREALRYESPAQARLMATLLDTRNALMAERLLPHFAEAGTFAAVGALHLPGKGGLLERFTAAGFRVRALDR